MASRVSPNTCARNVTVVFEGWPRPGGPGYGDPAAGRRWRLQKLPAWLSACVQVPADRPTDGFGDADLFLGGAEQQVAFEFRIKAYRFDR